MAKDLYITVTVVVKIPKEIHKEWSEQVDFLSPAAELHDPENGRWVIESTIINKEYLDDRKYNVFNEEGGV